MLLRHTSTQKNEYKSTGIKYLQSTYLEHFTHKSNIYDMKIPFPLDSWIFCLIQYRFFPGVIFFSIFY